MKSILVAFALAFSLSVAANVDGAYFDAPYPVSVPPIDDANDNKDLQGFSDTDALLEMMTPVRSQASRGTCSIFSATALIEALMKMNSTSANPDLSEEFLQFVVNAGSTAEGSHASKNFETIHVYGMATERTLPYLGDNWLTWDNSLAQRRCGHLRDRAKQSCLIVHHDPANRTRSNEDLLDITKPWYDPDLAAAKEEGFAFKENHLSNVRHNYVFSTSEIKSLLEQGIPLILEMRVYYGAWNHRVADELDIGRNLDHWNRGIVGHPFLGSMDRAMSPTKNAGHSVLVVGYDDSVELTFEVKMEDGSYKTLTRKGVYYFKNSWGTSSFGAQTEINGVRRPGYGIMTQNYANEFGTFYRFSID